MSRKVYSVEVGNEEIREKIVDYYGGITATMLDELYDTNKSVVTKWLKEANKLFIKELIKNKVVDDSVTDLQLKVVYEGNRYCSRCDCYYWSDDRCCC